MMRGSRVSAALALAAALLLLALLGLPVAALVVRGGAEGVRQLATDAELRGSLLLTATVATIATLVTVILGTPMAYLLARDRVPGSSLVRAIIELPLLIPHPVAGIGLLLAFGRASVPGERLAHLGLAIVGSPFGIGLAMFFVAAPLYLSAAQEAIARVDERLEHVARTLGDTPWRAVKRITLPLAARGIVAASVVMWARCVSEFGAIVILTYNPKVVSVLSYDRFTTSGLAAAVPVAAVLVLLAIVPLLALRSLRVSMTARG